MKFLRQFLRSLFGVGGTEPMVGWYRADYSAISPEEIQAPAPCDEMLKTGDWHSVNRRVK